MSLGRTGLLSPATGSSPVECRQRPGEPGPVCVLTEGAEVPRQKGDLEHVVSMPEGLAGRLLPGQTTAARSLRNHIFRAPKFRQHHQTHNEDPLSSSPTEKPLSFYRVPPAPSAERACSLSRRDAERGSDHYYRTCV